MYDFISSIFNIIGEYINKLLDFLVGEKKEESKTATLMKVVDKAKPAAWVKKKQ